jgi:competence protein ComEC
MRAILATPLGPAAIGSIAIALAARASAPAAIAVAIALALLAAVLAVASADRSRRICWSAVSVTAGLAAASIIVGPLPGFDLRHSGPLDAVREALSLPLQRLIGEPEGGIVRGIVLGERASVDADLASAFARSGTTHLLAISGFNMTLVATGVGLIARGRVRPAATAAITVATVLAYSILVGLAPSVVRAALMAVVACCGLAFGRRPATVNALACAVAAMLAIDPGALGDVGFELSAVATAGLLFLGEPLSRGLSALPGAIREGLATTLAATLPTLPIIAAVFGRVSLVSPLANLLAVPLFPPLMLAGSLTAATGSFSTDLARLPALATWFLAFALRVVVETAAALPLASLAVPDGPIAGIAYAAATIAAIRFVPPLVASASRRLVAFAGRRTLPAIRVRLDARRASIAAAAICAVLVGAVAIAGVATPPPIRVRALDVGQGDAFLVEIGTKAMLVDGGPDPARLLAELSASLPPWRRRIDVVALTHAHADHADGLIAVLERYEVGLTLEPVGLNAGPVASAWADRTARAHVERRVVAAGARVRVGDATVAVLAPDGDPRVDVPSLVLRIERGSFSILFMGDATDQAQADLLLGSTSLATRVYVPPHHGAATPYASALVAAVHPAAAVISVGAQNRYGHPTPETLAALSRVTTYRTDRDGTVELDLDGTSLVVRTHANGLPPPRGGFVPHAPPAG